jgi:hypothetical protein
LDVDLFDVRQMESVMAGYMESFDHMLAAWNESDPSLVRSHLEKALAPQVRFVDPSIDVTGLMDLKLRFTMCMPRTRETSTRELAE